MTAVTLLSIIFIASQQAKNTAEDVAALWAPALLEVIQSTSAATSAHAGNIDTIRVFRDIQIVRRMPPTEAIIPRASARFAWLESALGQQGVPIRSMRVSGVSGDSIVWVEVQPANAAVQWLGVVSNIEGEDLPRRFLIVFGLSILLSAALATALSHMVAKPARMIAEAVRRDTDPQSQALPLLPTKGAAEILAIADSVAETLQSRRVLESERQLMLSGVSHDIRSPLARIRLATQLLPEDEAHAELRARILRNVDVIDDLVEDFANYLRIDVESLDEIINIRDLIDDVLFAGGMTQRVSVSGGGGDSERASESETIVGHSALLFRALSNLVENAVHHGKPPIEIAVRAMANEIAIDVLDQGKPIEARETARLVKPFERGESHRGTPGSGLGLAIVTRVVARHGGRLELVPRDDKPGTRASLVLPRRDG
jgi:two-component system, OmpR family, osmolarity sensor histidine kinase EnvZ